MLTTLICGQCGDAVAVTSRAVVLPFVCLRCQEQITDWSAVIDADNAKNLATVLKDPKVHAELAKEGLMVEEAVETAVAQFYKDMAPASETGALSEEFSSVENTTLLIEDLETQLVAAQESRKEAINDLANAELQIAFLEEKAEKAENLLVTIEGLEERISKGEAKNIQLLQEKERQAEIIFEARRILKRA